MPLPVMLGFFFNMGAGPVITNTGFLIFYVPATGAESVLKVG